LASSLILYKSSSIFKQRKLVEVETYTEFSTIPQSDTHTHFRLNLVDDWSNNVWCLVAKYIIYM